MISEFYIYCEDYDLDEVAEEMTERITQFVAQYGDRVVVVNRKEEGSVPDFPPWDLGVNYDERVVTRDEVKGLFLFFHTLSAEFDRSFLVGFVSEHGISEDIAAIEASTPLEETMRLVLDEN